MSQCSSSNRGRTVHLALQHSTVVVLRLCRSDITISSRLSLTNQLSPIWRTVMTAVYGSPAFGRGSLSGRLALSVSRNDCAVQSYRFFGPFHGLEYSMSQPAEPEMGQSNQKKNKMLSALPTRGQRETV